MPAEMALYWTAGVQSAEERGGKEDSTGEGAGAGPAVCCVWETSVLQRQGSCPHYQPADCKHRGNVYHNVMSSFALTCWHGEVKSWINIFVPCITSVWLERHVYVIDLTVVNTWKWTTRSRTRNIFILSPASSHQERHPISSAAWLLTLWRLSSDFGRCSSWHTMLMH